MRKSARVLAIGAAVVAGPLLATAAVTIGDYVNSDDSFHDGDFSLDAVFVDPAQPTPQYCWDNGDGTGGCVVTGGGRGWWGGGGGWGGGYDTRGEDGGGGGDPPPEVAQPTPCVEAAPAAAVLQDINNVAKTAAAELGSRDPATGQRRFDLAFEWATIIYVHNGQMFYTPWVGDNLVDEVNWNPALALVPDNAVIVGIMHHHPDDPVINDKIPSYYDARNDVEGRDWQVYDQFLGLQTRGVTTDPSLLMYIHSDEGGNDAYVYDRTDRNTRTDGCTL